MEITPIPTLDKEGSEALKELRSYLVRLDRRLSLLLGNVGSADLSNELRKAVYLAPVERETALRTEIIETASTVKELGDRIELKLANDYVAKSDIGSYTEQAFQEITVDGKGVTQYFEEISELSERVSGAEGKVTELRSENELISADVSRINAYIRSGKLDEGVYGIEIGNFAGGETAPYKVRLSENRLAFYVGDSEAAYFSDNSMFINRAHIPDTLSIGSCVFKSDNGIIITVE